MMVNYGCHDLPLKLTWASSSPKGRGEEKRIFSLPTLLKSFIPKATLQHSHYAYLPLYIVIALNEIRNDNRTVFSRSPKVRGGGGGGLGGGGKEYLRIPTPLKTFIPKASFKYSPYSYLSPPLYIGIALR